MQDGLFFRRSMLVLTLVLMVVGLSVFFAPFSSQHITGRSVFLFENSGAVFTGSLIGVIAVVLGVAWFVNRKLKDVEN